MSTSFVFRWWAALLTSDLRSTAKLVGFVLSTHMNGDGGSCWPSVPVVPTEASLSERAVRGGLRALEQAGFLGTARDGGRRSGGGYASNSYRALPPSPAPDSLNPAPPAGLSPAPRSLSPAPGAVEDVHKDVHKEDVHEDVEPAANEYLGTAGSRDASFQLPATTNGAVAAAATPPVHHREGRNVLIEDWCYACDAQTVHRWDGPDAEPLCVACESRREQGAERAVVSEAQGDTHD